MRLPWQRRDDIDEELMAHFRMAVNDRIARGQSPGDAARDARREFGNELVIRERLGDVWRLRAFDQLTQNLRYAIRQLRRTPAFTGIAVLSLACGLAAAAGAFAVVHSVLIQPLNYAGPERLFSVVTRPPLGTANRYWLINGRHFSEWRAHCRSCEDIGMAESVGFTLADSGEPERFSGLRVSYNFFRTLGVQPALGRDFRAAEELPGDFHELMLSDAVWRSRFSADPAAVGRTVHVSGDPYTIIGVMPANFRLPVGGQWGPEFGPADTQPAMFRPLGQDFSTARSQGNNNYVAVVRLRDGVSADQASAELGALVAPLVSPGGLDPRPVLLPLQATVVSDARQRLLLLLGIALAALFVVSANVGTFMLVRTAGRDREVGIRLALGSSRQQLFLLVTTEAVVLVIAALAVSALMTSAFLQAFTHWAPPTMPRLAEIHAGPRTWLFEIGASVAATIVCGLLPAWRMARGTPATLVKTQSAQASPVRSRIRLRELMVSIEVGSSTVLLVIACLLSLSFLRVLQAPKGFESDNVVTVDMSVSDVTYNESQRIQLLDTLLDRLRAIPGVQSAAVTNQLPLRGETWLCGLYNAPDREVAVANFRFVSGGYFETLGIPLRQGRTFSEADRSRGVAIVDERAARLLWPHQNPLGRRIGACGGERPKDGVEVIGVTADVRTEIERDAPITVYQPSWAIPMTRAYFAVRSREALETLAPDLRAAFRAVNPELAVGQPVTMRTIVSESVANRRFQMALVVAFAAFAVALAALGVYGVISFTVARRTQELGIRMALGATPQSVALMVLRQGILPVVAGLICGVACAAFAARGVRSQLYGVTPSEPLVTYAIVGILLGVGVLATLLPAHRAMRTNPLTALRHE